MSKTSCTLVKGGGEASGVVTNREDKEVDYTITVTFTNDKGTNVGQGQTTVKAEASDKTDWTVKASFAAPKALLCVVVAVS